MENIKFSNRLSKLALVKFLTAITYSNEDLLISSINELEKTHGEIDLKSASFEFKYTKYYDEEMGSGLKKQFFSFKTLGSPEQLVDRKHQALELEKEFSLEGRRQVNIDPAYLELAKLVVASTKNFAHRIYLGRGIYGDLQLRYCRNEFIANEWTYPDYKSELSLQFLSKTRKIYFKQLKNS